MMRNVISMFLSLFLLATITVSSFNVNAPAITPISTERTALLPDHASEALVGQGPNAKKFVSGAICGAGGVLLVAGFAGGLFTGGVSAVIAGLALAGSTASACAEAF
jgi:hypothetical protein